MGNKTLYSILIVQALALVALMLNILDLRNTRPTTEEVAAMLEPESKIYEMLNARMDCERNIPRTQECVLYYEYIPVNEYPEQTNE